MAGVARNIVLRAVAEARAAGATLVFLFADANDWPQQLYGGWGSMRSARHGCSPDFRRRALDPAKSQDA